MLDGSIIGKDAKLYIENIEKHNIENDIKWLLENARFPVGCKVLDVGCGTGKLIYSLLSDEQFSRSVKGVEISSELVSFSKDLLKRFPKTIFHSNFLDWENPKNWYPDTIVMSFFLHHCQKNSDFLDKAYKLLPHGGRLYIFDRIATNKKSLFLFKDYWENYYKNEHEWEENIPNLKTLKTLINEVSKLGFKFVKKTVSQFDLRPGTEGFPKTLLEFWKSENNNSSFPAVLVVSPMHQNFIDEIKIELNKHGLSISKTIKFFYSNDLIKSFYYSAPWRDILVDFVNEISPNRIATAIFIEGDYNNPDLLRDLSEFKLNTRNLWPNFQGNINTQGFKPMILPFHVPEPYESQDLVEKIKGYVISE